MSGMYEVMVAFERVPCGDHVVSLHAKVTDPEHRMFPHKLDIVIHRGDIAPEVNLRLALTFDLFEPLIATVDIVVGNQHKVIEVTVDDMANRFKVTTRNLAQIG